MRDFNEIFQIAAKRHGGAEALNAKLEPPPSVKLLREKPDAEWLSVFSKAIFSAGFNWKVVQNKWPGFEEVFHGFDVPKVAMMPPEDFDALMSDTRLIRNGTKLKAVQDNAVFLLDLAKEHGTASRFIADWPGTNYVGLLEVLKKKGSRLGGTSAQYALRFGGKDSFILSQDVTARLIAEGVIDKPATSKKAMEAVQIAFNTWADQSGRSLKEVSQTLAMSL